MHLQGRLALHPRPATRPRFTCRGRFAVAYTDKPYRQWLDAAIAELRTLPLPEGWDQRKPMNVQAVFLIPKPKTSKLLYPKPDIDNYEKALLDAITQAEGIWEDDCQVLTMTTSKTFVTDEAEAGIAFVITPMEIT